MIGAWTEEAVGILRLMFDDGKSSGQIAYALSDKFGRTYTRNSVIGRLHRMGLWPADRKSFVPKLSSTERNKKRREKRAAKHQVAFQRPPVIPFAVVAPQPIAKEPRPKRPITLVDLTDDTCRFPYGDGRDEPYVFCGKNPVGGSPYCQHHSVLCFQPSAYSGRGYSRREAKAA